MEFDAQRMVVIGLRPGCAAAHSQQIQVGDQLISVEGQQPTDFKQARDLILGTQGTSVSLTFKKQSSNTRYAVTLLRGTAEYFLMAERCKQLETRIAQIEKEKPQSQDVPLRPTPEDVKAHVSAQVSIAALQKKVEELESENNELRHTVMSNRRNGAENGASVQKLQVELQEAADEKQMLGKQVTQLQRLIGEKDSQIKDVKAKSRDLQGSLARRLKDLEDVLKDRVEAKNERIVDLNKQLMDARAETEGLRAENQALRNVVNQTNQKLNALISLQMDAADREGGHVNQELIMLRSKTASLEAEIQVYEYQSQIRYQRFEASKPTSGTGLFRFEVS
jgi:predicted  nucleic acid-binding Zn-ribbon protein